MKYGKFLVSGLSSTGAVVAAPVILSALGGPLMGVAASVHKKRTEKIDELEKELENVHTDNAAKQRTIEKLYEEISAAKKELADERSKLDRNEEKIRILEEDLARLEYLILKVA